jgi:hypothetical protein
VADDDLVYELDEWEPHERDAVSRALGEAGIGYSWDGATLAVQSADEATVERILDEVDQELDLELDPGADKVAYDLSSWSDAQRGELVGALADHAVPHEWSDDDELFIHEEDEQSVDELLDRVTRGESLSSDGHGDGAPGAELLGELFVAADRLMHDPRDHEGTLSLMDSARVALEAPAPYGFDEKQWDALLDAVGSLVLLVGDQAIDDDAVIGQATTVRTILRPLV